jgi:hypothetical protein
MNPMQWIMLIVLVLAVIAALGLLAAMLRERDPRRPPPSRYYNWPEDHL